ncbi:MAG: hypothetical protein IPO93_10860 [Actinobacteria bacterium]|nr:hypothetical protein [Actinomycetota bacterium]
MRVRRWLLATVLSVAAISATGPSTATASPLAPAGDISVATAPRPPFDTGTGEPIMRTVFTNADRTVACRRVAGDEVWLECLLVRSHEIVRFGMAGGTVAHVPCQVPFADDTCALSFGRITIRPATAASRARYAAARAVPLERLVELGRRTIPYPLCIFDPNLGLSCTTGMDDSVGEQIYIGVSDSIWSCPGYEYIDDQTPIPSGNNRCTVLWP